MNMTFHQKPNLYIRDITLNISNLRNSVTFYTEFLGFKILKQEEKTAILTADGINPIIMLHQPEGVTEKEPRKTGLYHFAILLPTRKDLGAILHHLVQNKYPLGAADHAVSEALYLQDPDGNGVEIYYDRPSDEWIWNDGQVHMTTEQLDGAGVLAAAQGKQWDGMPVGTIIGHIHLHVSDLQESGKFYENVLGYEVVCEYGAQALFLSTGNYHHHVGMNTWNGVGAPSPSENSVGMKQYSIAIPDRDYLQNIIQTLNKLDLAYYEAGDTVLINDPSNNKILLHVEK